MSVFKIALRSIQHRGFGSWLTIISMALGVMMVVAVLSIHGLVSQSFKNNNSFGYNVLVGARGGGLQLTMNTVYYLSSPVENVPYEYYLAFVDRETRQRELRNSLAWQGMQHEVHSRQLAAAAAPGGGGLAAAVASRLAEFSFESQQAAAMGTDQPGLYHRYTDVAVPLCMGDYYVNEKTGAAFRCVGTKPNFFSDLVLDVDSEEKFHFSQGRCFQEHSAEHGFYECVIGAMVAKRCGLQLGETIKPTHGDPNSANAHIHDTPFTIVGIVDATGTPNDRVVFLNIEGFYLMAGHTKPIDEERVLKTADEDVTQGDADETPAGLEVDLFADEEDESNSETIESETKESEAGQGSADEAKPAGAVADKLNASPLESLTPLPIEQREVTSILVRTSKNDEYGVLSIFLPAQINEGDLETTLDWSSYRPERAQKAAQAVNPVEQVTSLFQLFVDPVRWLLLALTCMICVVSALSILVGIYNSMNQRQHEIAVMRALGASRTKVMMIMLSEAILLALAGGLLGWFSGHVLNAGLSPWVESKTGVPISFFDFAPGIPLGYFPVAASLPADWLSLAISPELMLIPALMLLAVLVGIYPAISAYRTDVSQALGK